MTETQKKALEIIKNNPGMSYQEIAWHLYPPKDILHDHRRPQGMVLAGKNAVKRLIEKKLVETRPSSCGFRETVYPCQP